MSDINLTDKQVEVLACFRVSTDDMTLRIECNWCSTDDYIFSEKEFDNNAATSFDPGWIPRGATHASRYHKELLERHT